MASLFSCKAVGWLVYLHTLHTSVERQSQGDLSVHSTFNNVLYFLKTVIVPVAVSHETNDTYSKYGLCCLIFDSVEEFMTGTSTFFTKQSKMSCEILDYVVLYFLRRKIGHFFYSYHSFQEACKKNEMV